MFAKLKAWLAPLFTGIGGNIQIAFALVVNFFGDFIDAIGMVINDPTITDQLTAASPPNWLGNITKGLAAVSIVVKIRTAWKVARKIGGAA